MNKNKDEKILSKIKQALKDYDVKFIDILVDETTEKEKKRFKKYRLPLTSYIQRLPNKKQFPVRLSPKKRPPVPLSPSPKKVVPKKKKINLTYLVDDKIDLLIEKITILKDIAFTQPKNSKEKTIKFFSGIKHEIKDFMKDML